MDAIDYDQTAAAGAAVLDTVRPGWEDRIDPDTLNLESKRGCVLGQVFQAEYDGYAYVDGCRLLGFEPAGLFRQDSREIALGFNVPQHSDDAMPMISARFAELTAAWLRIIDARLSVG